MRILGTWSVFFTLVMFAPAAAFASIEFKSGFAVLRLSERCGAVESLVADGVERVVPAAEAFTL